MKKRTLVILSILLVLVPLLFVALKGMFVPFQVVKKEEKRFSAPSPINIVQPKDRKLIKTGDLSFECQDLNRARDEVVAQIDEQGGFIVKERMYEGYDRKTSNQSLEIRVPSANFDALVKAISTKAKRVDQRSIEIEDVTERYLDTEARLAVKRDLEARYRALLSVAESVKDMLEIEEQLAKVREDIESAEGGLKRLDDQIALSTLEVTFYVRLSDSPAFGRYFRDGLANGWENLSWFLVALLNIWPFLVIVLLMLSAFKFRKK